MIQFIRDEKLLFLSCLLSEILPAYRFLINFGKNNREKSNHDSKTNIRGGS